MVEISRLMSLILLPDLPAFPFLFYRDSGSTCRRKDVNSITSVTCYVACLFQEKFICQESPKGSLRAWSMLNKNITFSNSSRRNSRANHLVSLLLTYTSVMGSINSQTYISMIYRIVWMVVDTYMNI